MSHRLPCEFIQDLLPLYIDGITGRNENWARVTYYRGVVKLREEVREDEQTD